MAKISSSLINSLTKLGLSSYEANVYATLVLMDNAEVKEIVDYCGLSKPCVYDALEQLETIGLAVKRVSKPARYSPISSEMAIDLLQSSFKEAADLARVDLKNLENETVKNEKEDALWTIYGDTNIGYKIRDLLKAARKQITCMIGERYVPAIEDCNIGEVSLRLMVISDNPDLEQKLRAQFQGKNAEVHVIPSKKYGMGLPFVPLDFEDFQKFWRIDNILELLVDDDELLMVPPFVTGNVSVLNTKNKGMIIQMKRVNEFNWKRLVEGCEDNFLMFN